MKPANEELDRRRPVWEASSELFVDTAITESTLEYVARKLAASPYCADELEEILKREVGPALASNLRGYGIWQGFDAQWLESEILNTLKPPRGWRRWFPRSNGFHLIEDYWYQVRGIFIHKRLSNPPAG